jgi:glycosyltransferase involved in cell wall biosynthesis
MLLIERAKGLQDKKLASIDELWVTVIPSVEDYAYLQCLYREVLELAKEKKKRLYLYSPSSAPGLPSTRSLVRYPLEILFLLLRRKTCTDTRTILHLHWIEFLYQWAKSRYLIPFIAPFMIIFFRLIKRFSRTRLVVTAHNLLPHNVEWFAIEYIYFRTMLLKVSDGIFVHNNLQRNSLMNFYGIPRGKIHVIQHGLIESRKPRMPSSRQREETRDKFNISRDDIVLFFLGSISEYKGIEVLLEAIHKLPNTAIGGNLRFLIAGRIEKDYALHLLDRYSETLKDRRVTLIGKHISQEEVEDIYSVTDFGICPYTRATTPSTVLDFMYHGLPIITTDDPNVLEQMKDYPSVIAKRGDSLSLANCIAYARDRREEYKQMAQTFDLRDRYSAWRVSAETTLELYAKIAAAEA